MKTVVKAGKKVEAPVKREFVKKTFEMPADLAFGLKRLAIDESEHQGRSVAETEIVQRLIRAELDRVSTKRK